MFELARPIAFPTRTAEGSTRTKAEFEFELVFPNAKGLCRQNLARKLPARKLWSERLLSQQRTLTIHSWRRAWMSRAAMGPRCSS